MISFHAARRLRKVKESMSCRHGKMTHRESDEGPAEPSGDAPDDRRHPGSIGSTRTPGCRLAARAN